jgi:hypothetical protein
MKHIVSKLSDLILSSKPSPSGRRLASRRMAARTTFARGHPSRRIARAMLLSMNTLAEPHQNTVFMVRVQRRFRSWELRMRLGELADMIRISRSLNYRAKQAIPPHISCHGPSVFVVNARSKRSCPARDLSSLPGGRGASAAYCGHDRRSPARPARWQRLRAAAVR